MAETSRPSILIVDDEPHILDLFESILESNYVVHTRDSGQEALDAIDEHIDVCLLDRRMPGMSGEEVVRRLRERGFELPVAMVTAVEPDFDFLDIGFDDYLLKPVSADDLEKLVDGLLLKRDYDDVLREYFALASKVSALKERKSTAELGSNEDYRRTIDRLNQIKQEATHSLETADDAGMLEELFWESFLEGQTAELDG